MRHSLLAAFAMFIATPILAQDADEVIEDVAEAAPEGGKIIMYRRGSVVGAALGCPIRYKGEEITELARGKFSEWNVAPGRYILENKTSSVEVYVEPGETRFIRCQIKPGFATGRADLQIVDGSEFEKLADQLQRSHNSPD